MGESLDALSADHTKVLGLRATGRRGQVARVDGTNVCVFLVVLFRHTSYADSFLFKTEDPHINTSTSSSPARPPGQIRRSRGGCLTGVNRTLADAATLLDGKYCLTGGDRAKAERERRVTPNAFSETARAAWQDGLRFYLPV